MKSNWLKFSKIDCFLPGVEKQLLRYVADNKDTRASFLIYE